MSQSETLIEKHTRLARRLLDQADQELMVGDLIQGSEKLWGAASHALKAVCELRGWRHSKYAQREAAANRLSQEFGDPTIIRVYRLAEACHANFYNDWLEETKLRLYRDDIRQMVEKILAL